jgi:hypothetical protein
MERYREGDQGHGVAAARIRGSEEVVQSLDHVSGPPGVQVPPDLPDGRLLLVRWPAGTRSQASGSAGLEM